MNLVLIIGLVVFSGIVILLLEDLAKQHRAVVRAARNVLANPNSPIALSNLRREINR